MDNHSELVLVAGRWLAYRAVLPTPGIEGGEVVRCPIVMTELVTAARSVPDAIGWHHCGRCSILVEVKVSRSDFFADRRKMARRMEHLSVGRYRYYLTPPGLVDAAELPAKWGLLECKGRRKVEVVHLPERQEDAAVNLREEMVMMASVIRRQDVQIRQHSKANQRTKKIGALSSS